MNKKIIGVILGLVILACILYFVFRSRRKHSVFVKSPQFLVDDYNKSFSQDKIYNSEHGIKYTYLFCIYINNMPENGNWHSNYTDKKGIVSHFNSPNIFYLPDKHILEINVGYKDPDNTISKYQFDIEDLLFQKWIHIGLVVKNRYASVFVNGKMIKATYLPNVPWFPNRTLYLGQKDNNFNGYIGYFEYFNDALSSDEIMKISKKRKMPSDLITYSEYYYKKYSKK